MLSLVRAALLGMAAIIASSAHAFQNYTMTANTFNIPSGTHVGNSVLCNHPTQKVIGGGFTIAGATGTMRKYYATASEPSTALNGWNVAVQNNDVQLAKVVIYAICATGVEKLHRPFANWSLGPASTTATASAVCLPGTKVLSGDFVISGSPPHLYATRSRAVASKWTADIRNNGTTASDSTSAVCALANSAAYGIFNSAFTVPAQGFFTQTRNCPPGRQILGGGFAITGATTAAYYATQSSPAQGSPGWTVTVQNNQSTAVNAIAYAICGL